MTQRVEHSDVLVVGAGPAGLMAADVLSAAGHHVLLAEAKPSPARKFLMAGKSGLNLTKNEAFEPFLQAYAPVHPVLQQALEDFGPQEAIAWAEALGQQMFTGSSGRVFPKAMKASPLLRAWLGRLADQGVDLRRNWRMEALGERVGFATSQGSVEVAAKVVILALGGASWARLGSNGAWVEMVQDYVELRPFAPSNVGVTLAWSGHMARHFGHPVKGVHLRSGAYESRGEFVISERGLEGGGIYSVTRGLRDGAPLVLDLLPDWSAGKLEQRLIQRKPKETLTKFLKRALRLSPEKIALLMEFAGPQPDDLAASLKALEITGLEMRPMDEAISTAGGVRFESLTDSLESRKKQGLFFAGEMLDWDAPTGGYLLTACLATGRRAAQGALMSLA
ncbi:TIGR03862 family flavoprotein [Celeribacter halophilus]|uniref:TIGR03862 family flavoprotein n=1 Tax=Celeribacter halophilus TaxID=576117 RepID=A0AAW7XXK5_9RHOB|nr:TIGR03862 family flavoprotein [Celeribacter halophilus]MDO6457687.1 TIGR03862 family flavoprotein [Celeribacter halophilus]